ncbi:MAG UNVERIFIED_CONTAM: hypothetical protein LVT10_14700 [Anaerolineae bacterium]
MCQPTIIAVTNVKVFEANHSFHDAPRLALNVKVCIYLNKLPLPLLLLG